MDTAHYCIDLPAAVAGGTIPVTLGCDARFVANRIATDPRRAAVAVGHP